VDIAYYRTTAGREPAREYIGKLPMRDQAAVLADFTLVREYGIVDAPVVTRHLTGKLWEIKTGVGRQQRVFYCLQKGDLLVVLHACKKQRTGAQRADVELAKRRMREVLP
jgi:phage-related protein